MTELRVLHGRPSDVLQEWALEDGYDLIVVGSRGTGLAKRVIGSAASELAAAARIPVLITG